MDFKHLTDEQLKKATILDLTDDVELMRKALDDELFDPSEVERYTESAKMLTLIEFAEYTQNDLLLKRLKNLFGDEYEAIFNE